MITATLVDSGGITLSAQYDHENPGDGDTWLTKLEGWSGGVSVKGDQLSRATHGDFALRNYRTRRTLTLAFMAERDSREELWALERGISGLFSDGGFGTLEVKQDDDSLSCEVELDGEPKVDVQLDAGLIEVELPLSSPEPWLYSPWNRVQLKPKGVGIGLEYPLFTVGRMKTSDNLVANPTVTNSTTGWDSSQSTALLTTEYRDMGRGNRPALKHSRLGNSQITSDAFEVDPTKTYEVKITLDKPIVNEDVTGSDLYFGLYTEVIDGERSSVTTVKTSNGESIGSSSNFYFTQVRGPFDGPLELTGYILPYGTPESAAKGLGNTTYAAIFENPSTKTLQLRFLNYNNGDLDLPVWASDISITETEQILTFGSEVEEDVLVWNDGNANSYPIFTVYADTPGGFRVQMGNNTVAWPRATFKSTPIEIHMDGKVIVGGFDQSQFLTERDWAPIAPHTMETPKFELLQGGTGWCEVAFRDTNV